jgi:hypothetical protein
MKVPFIYVLKDNQSPIKMSENMPTIISSSSSSSTQPAAVNPSTTSNSVNQLTTTISAHLSEAWWSSSRVTASKTDAFSQSNDTELEGKR